MEQAWVTETAAKGLPAEKYMTRLRELRDQYQKKQ
jgi:hypothetical protein